jgi:hypothetical protein
VSLSFWARSCFNACERSIRTNRSYSASGRASRCSGGGKDVAEARRWEESDGEGEPAGEKGQPEKGDDWLID